MMEPDPLAEVLTAQRTAVLQRLSDGAFRLLNQPPRWYTLFIPSGDAWRAPLRPAGMFAYLEVFLPEAEPLWTGAAEGELRSGLWSETAPDGTEVRLEALALRLKHGSFLLLRQLELEYAERQRLLQTARERALDHERLIRETGKKEILLHCVVHDLGGPLAAMQSCLELLGQERLTPRGAEFARLGLGEAAKQANLIQDLLDIFASELRSIQAVEADPTQLPDVAESAQEALSGLCSLFTVKSVAAHLTCEPSLPRAWRVLAERSGLERVFYNLLENALRFAPRGSSVEVRLLDEGASVRAAIEDSGPGVAEDIAPRLFGRFVKGSRTSGRAGLGLYSCRLTVERWGGVIGYEPRSGGGSRFWFRLRKPA